jgi:hypothetical protein
MFTDWYRVWCNPEDDPMNEEKKYWLDNPRNVDKICYVLYVVCALLVVADLFYHKHIHFNVEGWFGFYGFYGWVACVVLVLAAKVLRLIVGRKEDYYD